MLSCDDGRNLPAWNKDIHLFGELEPTFSAEIAFGILDIVDNVAAVTHDRLFDDRAHLLDGIWEAQLVLPKEREVDIVALFVLAKPLQRVLQAVLPGHVGHTFGEGSFEPLLSCLSQTAILFPVSLLNGKIDGRERQVLGRSRTRHEVLPLRSKTERHATATKRSHV